MGVPNNNVMSFGEISFRIRVPTDQKSVYILHRIIRFQVYFGFVFASTKTYGNKCDILVSSPFSPSVSVATIFLGGVCYFLTMSGTRL
jgi:hypothetical protein